MVSLEEGQSRRRVAYGPMTLVVEMAGWGGGRAGWYRALELMSALAIAVDEAAEIG